MADITPEARERLDKLMDERRLDLGLEWRQVADRAGLSYEVLRNLRTGPGGSRQLTMRKFDTALEWRGGSIERVLAGGNPEDLLNGNDRHSTRHAREASDNIRRERDERDEGKDGRRGA